MKILVVDDSITMRKIITKNLAAQGFEDVVEAENGSDALGKMDGVELVLTDWNMPLMDGLALVKEIRKDAAYSNVPIVMVTAEGAKKEVIQAMKAGVNEYIIKPFTPALLVEKVKSIVGN